MVLYLQDRIAEGGFADIFAPGDGSRVYKLFYRGRSEKSDRVSRAAFASECEAYSRLKNEPTLLRHVPQFYGRVQIDEVLDDCEGSHSERYLLDCCYCVERLIGEDRKVGQIPREHRSAVLALAERLEKVGVHHVLDGSFFNWDDPTRLRVIDFAVRDTTADFI